MNSVVGARPSENLGRSLIERKDRAPLPRDPQAMSGRD
jgi:hypothetical protein